VSGAGATPRDDLHFPQANDSLRAYKVLQHDHSGEIASALGNLAGVSAPPTLRFTPHLVPMNRGLLVTAYAPALPGVSADEVQALYAKAYDGAPCVRLVDEPDTAHVRHTNRADVRVDLDEATGLLVVRSAIDNLLKGGAGQAVQSMNLALGWDETAGLPLIGGGP